MARRKRKAARRVGTAGIIIAQGRRALGWSVEDLASRSGVSVYCIAHHERGERQTLRPPYAKAIAEALTGGGFHVSKDQLLAG